MFLLPQFINTDSIKYRSAYLVWKLGPFILCSRLYPGDRLNCCHRGRCHAPCVHTSVLMWLWGSLCLTALHAALLAWGLKPGAFAMAWLFGAVGFVQRDPSPSLPPELVRQW